MQLQLQVEHEIAGAVKFRVATNAQKQRQIAVGQRVIIDNTRYPLISPGKPIATPVERYGPQSMVFDATRPQTCVSVGYDKIHIVCVLVLDIIRGQPFHPQPTKSWSWGKRPAWWAFVMAPESITSVGTM